MDAFSPLPFNAAVDAQGIYGAHKVNLADTLLVRIGIREICVLSVNEVAETWKVPSSHSDGISSRNPRPRVAVAPKLTTVPSGENQREGTLRSR
jgi:hypothetical protein